MTSLSQSRRANRFAPNLVEVELTRQKRPRSNSPVSESANYLYGPESEEDYGYSHSGYCIKNLEFYFGSGVKLAADSCDSGSEDGDEDLLFEAETAIANIGGR
jgi:hypothetical protein